MRVDNKWGHLPPEEWTKIQLALLKSSVILTVYNSEKCPQALSIA